MERSDPELHEEKGAELNKERREEGNREVIRTSIHGKGKRRIQIDLKAVDAQLGKHLDRVYWDMEKEERAKTRDKWEIDVNDLVVLDKIGQGTFGSVYRGVFQGQDVAVKFLDRVEDPSITPEAAAAIRSAFRQEAAVWHCLQHPNITKFMGASMGSCGLVDSGSDVQIDLSNAAFVLAEYVAGGTLRSYLIKNGSKKLPFDTVVKLASDLSKGLSYLHSKRIVHRDIKPDNLLLDVNGTLKIADFGAARVEALNPKEMTGKTGTLGYMAPEVLDGNPYNRKADVYSFGICLWEICCCKVPFGNMNFEQICSAVVKRNTRPGIPRSCPDSLANVIKMCWDGSPEKRPEMEEVVRILENIDKTEGGETPDLRYNPCGCFGLLKPSLASPRLQHRKSMSCC